MKYTSLISAYELNDYLGDPNWVLVDCRFDLDNPDAGIRSYQQSHIPGALYAHLDEDLCGEIIPGETGRHPLPDVDDFVETLGNWGITSGTQVVTYDDKGGALAAGRLWWMLRWLGHDSVAVLNGGWQQWLERKLPVTSEVESRSPKTFKPSMRWDLVVNADKVMEMIIDPDSMVFDSRLLERYKGEFEPIDPIAGHIPGAKSAPHPDILNSEGLFLPQDALYKYFSDLLGDVPAEKTAFYCGSGATAVQNILGLYHAGLGEAKLYAGSWSEWITDPNRPIEK
jgi:thiosulfate/3-mercaptopyruvate sulfurtransferase